MKFLGPNNEININQKNPEFKEWKWVDIKILPDLIVSFKKDLYVSIIKEFSGSI